MNNHVCYTNQVVMKDAYSYVILSLEYKFNYCQAEGQQLCSLVVCNILEKS